MDSKTQGTHETSPDEEKNIKQGGNNEGISKEPMDPTEGTDSTYIKNDETGSYIEDTEIVDVFGQTYREVYHVPSKLVAHLPPESLNITRLVVCKNYSNAVAELVKDEESSNKNNYKKTDDIHETSDAASAHSLEAGHKTYIYINGIRKMDPDTAISPVDTPLYEHRFDHNYNSQSINPDCSISSDAMLGSSILSHESSISYCSTSVCRLGNRCKFVHINAHLPEVPSDPLHVNYTWRGFNDVTYNTLNGWLKNSSEGAALMIDASNRWAKWGVAKTASSNGPPNFTLYIDVPVPVKPTNRELNIGFDPSCSKANQRPIGGAKGHPMVPSPVLPAVRERKETHSFSAWLLTEGAKKAAAASLLGLGGITPMLKTEDNGAKSKADNKTSSATDGSVSSFSSTPDDIKARHCEQYYYNQFCKKGEKCNYLHIIHVDSTLLQPFAMSSLRRRKTTSVTNVSEPPQNQSFCNRVQQYSRQQQELNNQSKFMNANSNASAPNLHGVKHPSSGGMYILPQGQAVMPQGIGSQWMTSPQTQQLFLQQQQVAQMCSNPSVLAPGIVCSDGHTLYAPVYITQSPYPVNNMSLMPQYGHPQLVFAQTTQMPTQQGNIPPPSNEPVSNNPSFGGQGMYLSHGSRQISLDQSSSSQASIMSMGNMQQLNHYKGTYQFMSPPYMPLSNMSLFQVPMQQQQQVQQEEEKMPSQLNDIYNNLISPLETMSLESNDLTLSSNSDSTALNCIPHIQASPSNSANEVRSSTASPGNPINDKSSGMLDINHLWRSPEQGPLTPDYSSGGASSQLPSSTSLMGGNQWYGTIWDR